MNVSDRSVLNLLGLSIVASLACAGSNTSGSAPGDPYTGPFDGCWDIYSRDLECAAPDDRESHINRRDATLRACRLDDERELARRTDCTLEADCAAYRACVGGETAPREPAGEAPVDLARLLDECKTGGLRERNTTITCNEVFRRSYEAATADVTALRDAGGDALSRCFDLKTLAARISAAEQTQADALCKESEAGKRAKEALDEAGRNLRDGVLEVPYQCGLAVEDLEALASEWARTRLQEVNQACTIELGKKILPAVVTKMRTCDYQVEQVYKAVKKFNLQDPELDPWIAKAARKCK